jgi:hypothetical protein
MTMTHSFEPGKGFARAGKAGFRKFPSLRIHLPGGSQAKRSCRELGPQTLVPQIPVPQTCVPALTGSYQADSGQRAGHQGIRQRDPPAAGTTSGNGKTCSGAGVLVS